MDTQMTEQLMEAGVLLAVGMSVVFAFLSLLIAAIHAIAWFCRAFPSAEIESSKSHHKQANNNISSTSVSPQIAAAITAAVHTHRHTTLRN